MGEFLVLTLLGGAPALVLQFFCCFLKPKLLKFIPFGIFGLLWLWAGQTSGWDSPYFLMTLLTVPILIGMSLGWAVYGWFLALRKRVNGPGTPEQKELAKFGLIVIWVLIIALSLLCLAMIGEMTGLWNRPSSPPKPTAGEWRMIRLT